MASGTKLFTQEMTADTVYEIVYQSGDKLDIMNGTAGALSVGYDEDFEQGTLTIPEGGCYNGLTLNGNSVFLKSEADGPVSIVRV